MYGCHCRCSAADSSRQLSQYSDSVHSRLDSSHSPPPLLPPDQSELAGLDQSEMAVREEEEEMGSEQEGSGVTPSPTYNHRRFYNF